LIPSSPQTQEMGFSKTHVGLILGFAETFHLRT